MKQDYNKVELTAEVKKVLLQDIGLAGKVIDAMGGEISLPSFTMMVYRDSPKFKKAKVKKVLSNHFSKDFSELVVSKEITAYTD